MTTTKPLFGYVACWKCGNRLPFRSSALWGEHFDGCMAATGLDGMKYDLVLDPNWPTDDPSGPRYVARLTA